MCPDTLGQLLAETRTLQPGRNGPKRTRNHHYVGSGADEAATGPEEVKPEEPPLVLLSLHYSTTITVTLSECGLCYHMGSV